jgi:Zn-dependent peptidase ImmA (M78 family)
MMTPEFIPGADIDKKALAHRRALGFSDDQIIDGMTLITKLKERYPNFNYIRVANGALNSAEAQWDDVKKQISLPENVFQGINRGNPRDVMSLLHEVGHMLLGHKGVLNRAPLSANEKISVRLRRMETQAKRYAAAFLIPDLPEIRKLSPQDIAARYNVSLEAAKIRKLEFINR